MKLGTCSTLLMAALALPALPAAAQEAQAKDDGPRTLFITYRCEPANRVAFREQMAGTGVRRFENWKKQGVLEDYRLLFNWYVDADSWDMLAVLTFPKYADVDRWREIEKTMPGGMTAEDLKLTSPHVTYSSDLTWSGVSSTTKSDPKKSVFFIIPYVYYPNTLESYMKYIDALVIPQTKGWLKEGQVASYAIYMNRYPTGRPWQVVFVLEFRDRAAFGQREKMIAKVRADLRKVNPAYQTLSESKLQNRVEKETAIADQLLPQ